MVCGEWWRTTMEAENKHKCTDMITNYSAQWIIRQDCVCVCGGGGDNQSVLTILLHFCMFTK